MKKILVIGVIALFIGVFIIPSSGIKVNSKIINQSGRSDTLFVGGNGSGNYTKIQDAIDNASDGDTVYVFNGTYNESINITVKSIKLFGEDKNITIINGIEKYPVIMIDIDNVHICGFTIQHSGGKGFGIFSYSNNNNFYNNIIINNYAGILLTTRYNISYKESCDNKIYNNIIKQNDDGIKIDVDSDVPLINLPKKGRANNVYNNIISNNNDIGIDVSGWYNTIFGNHISYNGEDSFNVGGIALGGLLCINNKIIYNNISNNKANGIIIVQGINTLVKNNNFINNDVNAYFIYLFMRVPNQWKSNYWDEWGGLGPKIIDGDLVIFDPDEEYGIGSKPIRNFDWRPAKYPYDIINFQDCGIE
ncbi:hypothetical protein AYK24_09400 [Thermoplasmatales archaeon SG8-52-4]|nr:MAG: hypothetical protein AYK24_09400 [Thermoplasmatales archaeon SG8-52-4]